MKQLPLMLVKWLGPPVVDQPYFRNFTTNLRGIVIALSILVVLSGRTIIRLVSCS